MSTIPTSQEIELQEQQLDEGLFISENDEMEKITDRAKAEHIHRYVLPTLVRRLYLFLFGEVEKETADAFIALLNDKYLTTTEYFDELFVKRTPSLHHLYLIGIKEKVFEDQGLGEKAMIFLTTRDKIQDLVELPVVATEGEEPAP